MTIFTFKNRNCNKISGNNKIFATPDTYVLSILNSPETSIYEAKSCNFDIFTMITPNLYNIPIEIYSHRVIPNLMTYLQNKQNDFQMTVSRVLRLGLALIGKSLPPTGPLITWSIFGHFNHLYEVFLWFP